MTSLCSSFVIRHFKKLIKIIKGLIYGVAAGLSEETALLWVRPALSSDVNSAVHIICSIHINNIVREAN